MMNKFYGFIFTILFSGTCARAQDLITTTTGIEFNARIESVTDLHIRYKRPDNPNTVYNMVKSDVHLIRYENGAQLFLNPVLPPKSIPEQKENIALQKTKKPAVLTLSRPDSLSLKQLYTLGKADANNHYRGYKTAGTFTYISSVVFLPAGLVTAIATGSTPPKARNFTFPDAVLSKEPEYVRGYHTNARKIKSRKVWINFGAGLGTTLLVFALVASR